MCKLYVNPEGFTGVYPEESNQKIDDNWANKSGCINY
jgi:hypothetical protein